MGRGEGAAQAGQAANKGKKDLARAEKQHGESIQAQDRQTAAIEKQTDALMAKSQAQPNGTACGKGT